MKKVLAFGSFDPLHKGHESFLKQAKALGDYLTVVVAHDSALREHKRRDSWQSAQERLAAVAEVPWADKVIIGNKRAHKYELLKELDFDVIALGYDQNPSDEKVREELDRQGKYQVEIVRLKPYNPEVYKSSKIRNQ